MKWRIGKVDARALVAFLSCCCFQTAFGQNLTDKDHGCYVDNFERALTDLITCEDAPECHSSCGEEHRYCESMNSMSIGVCRDICRSRNLRYYALEAGTQCFCGGALSDPFRYGAASSTSCTRPCSGNSSTTCGGEFMLQVYEFQDPVMGHGCFHPGFVRNSFIMHIESLTRGDKINYICLPLHAIIGDAQVTCVDGETWQPDMLPICNYTGVEQVPTTESATTMANPPSTQATTTTAKPIIDFLPYIIGGSVLFLFILVVCSIIIFICTKRGRSGNAGQNISLKPEPSPVTYLNTGFHGDEDDEEAVVKMPDVLPTTPGHPSSPAGANMYNARMSTFEEEPIYLNGEAARASAFGYVNENSPGNSPGNSPDDPPSPIYLNAGAALTGNAQSPPAPQTAPPGESTGYTKRYSATTDRPYPKRALSSEDAAGVTHTTGRPNPRGAKDGKGTKDLVGWSRPSSLYQRTEMRAEDDGDSEEDNGAVQPNALSAAMYAHIDRSRKSGSRETLNSEVSGNSFFADPAKSSATRL